MFKADVSLVELSACPKRPTPVISLLAVYFSQGETKMPNGKEVAKGDNEDHM